MREAVILTGTEQQRLMMLNRVLMANTAPSQTAAGEGCVSYRNRR
jgi:hypothetical protein